jgi:acyl-CoA dehydrogenase
VTSRIPDIAGIAATWPRCASASNSTADRRGIPEWLRRPWARSVKVRHPCKEAKMDALGEVNAREQYRDAESLLFNPHTYDPSHFDDVTRRLLRATIDWFEHLGKETLLQNYRECVWYADFLEFVAKEHLFAKLGTPAREANGDRDKRWDTSRISAFSEILAFYGVDYWYAWQVTILGLGPIWQSDNASARRRAAQWLDDGAVYAFGLSEREHGADIYTTDMVLTPDGGGGFRATGGKYYIGNGNVSRMVSVFGRRSDVDGPDGYVFFAADSQHENYRLVKNIVQAQMFVAEFRLENYPVRPQDVLHTGQAAFGAALNTVNVGKFNIGPASIGMCEHAMYEAVTHAHNRILYGNRVTGFPHVRRSFVDAYARLIAMKAYGDRAIDYFRTASPRDRRYLLFNPVSKMKITTEGEKVIELLWDVIAAKGFERDTYFRGAGKDVGALPKLEGTVHVNLALILKFMPNYLFAPTEQPAVPTRQDPVDDEFLFRQGPARGLGEVTFADWRLAFEPFAELPNVARFREHAEGFTTLLRTAAPDAEQQQDLDFRLMLGQLFTLIVYAQLILEQAELTGLDPVVLDTIFEVFVRDFSALAVELHGKASSTGAQQQWALANVRKPVIDTGRVERVWEQVEAPPAPI